MTERRGRTIRHLRWYIGGLLFCMSVINYIDRQTLSALSPFLKAQYHWNNSEYAFILNSFRVAYTIMQSVFGRVLDVVGTRAGLSASVAFYSVIAAATALARGKLGFAGFRFLLGSGEAANNPGASKVVSEWFPAKERAVAVGLFDSGSAIGGAVAPFIALGCYKFFGSWRPAFVLTASLGILWLVVWRKFFRLPDHHPNISEEELAYIRAARASDPLAQDNLPHVSWLKMLRYRQTCGIFLGRFLMDPYWFFMAEWFALFLKSRGFSMEQSAIGFWAPFLGADLGNFAGGGISSLLIAGGMSVGRARRAVLWMFGPCFFALLLVLRLHGYVPLMLTFAFTSFAFGCCTIMTLALPTDAFLGRAVASAMGFGGTGAGLGTLITTFLIGRISDRLSFEPVLIGASVIGFLSTLVIVAMVRERRTPDQEGILLDF